jgi:carbonic anhydrase
LAPEPALAARLVTAISFQIRIGNVLSRRKYRVLTRTARRIDGASMPFPKRLIEGYRVFRDARLRREQDRYRELAESGQSPETMVIGCCDSRVSPEVIFDARPGELFVVRNVANIVPPFAPDTRAHGVSAALEFGVAALKVKHIVVLGHAHCGGVKAFAEKAVPLSPSDFIGNWMRLMAPAAETVGPQRELPWSDYLMRLEQANVVNSLNNLLTFPRLRALIERGEIATHGAYFGVAKGELSVRDEASGSFVSMAAGQSALPPAPVK